MPSDSGKPDNELAVSASQGNEEAFREILNRNRSKILSICLRMLKNSTEAAEAAQDSFVKIYFHLKEFDPERNFSSWAATIAINECRDKLRKRARFNQTFREITEVDIDRNQPSADNVYENKGRVEQVEKAIEQLPGKLKETLVLKAYGEYSYDEIAEILKIKTGTVMSRLFRAREKLTEMLKRDNLI